MDRGMFRVPRTMAVVANGILPKITWIIIIHPRDFMKQVLMNLGF
jgi:hypothetical protein